MAVFQSSSQAACVEPGAHERGSSLIELMIGMLAAVLVIGSTLSMTTQHARMRKVDEEILLALTACRNNLEELRSLPFAGLPSMHAVGFDVPGKNGNPAGLDPVEGDPDGLPGEFSITVDQSAGSELLYLVQATVTWRGVMGPQVFRLETLMGPRP